MNVVPDTLIDAALAARERLSDLARRAATAGAGAGSSPVSAMAAAARTAIFSDALLGAMRARLEELRSASK